MCTYTRAEDERNSYGGLGTLAGEQLCHFHGSLPYILGSSHKGKNLLPFEQTLTFMR